MQSVLSILNRLSAPYLLSEGSLLHLYRNCSVGLSDIDFSLEQEWWKMNQDNLHKAMEKAGFNRTAVFGKIENFGYEEAWEESGVKVDIFGNVIREGISTIGFWVQGKLYSCSLPVKNVSFYKWRETVLVRIPVPVKDAVIAIYGRNFDHPLTDWKWDIYPFLTGYCSYKSID